jgi:NADPH-dependent 2,4-dienoyl-CoA reductase/sulfur reductase-like enzyme
VPSELRRESGEGMRRVIGDEAVSVVLDDREPEASGDLGDFVPPTLRDRQRRRILKRRVEIDRLRRVASAGVGGSTVFHSSNHLEVAVVGGGQAGLSASYYLKERGVRHLVFESTGLVSNPSARRSRALCLVSGSP